MPDNDNSNVVVLDVETTLDIPLERVTSAAQENGVNGVLLLGYDANGDFYMASQGSNPGEWLLLLERARARISCLLRME